MLSGGAHTKRLAHELAHRPLPLVIFETSFLVIIALVALLGNICVLYIFYKIPRLRTVTGYYIITLAISDTFMALVVMPATIATSSYGRDVIGSHFGPAFGAFGYILVFGSLQTTSLIAVNRFFCVVKRTVYKKYFTPRFIKGTICLVWVLAFLNTVIVTASGLATMTFSPGRLIHSLNLKDKKSNEIFLFISLLFFSCLPMSLTAVCYWKVYQTVKIHKSKLSSRTNTKNILTCEEINVTKSVLAIVSGFALCWVPCSIVVLLSMYIHLPRYAEMIFTYSAYMSSAINPVLFNAFNKPFRRHMKRELCIRKRIQSENNTAAVDTFAVPIQSLCHASLPTNVDPYERRIGWGNGGYHDTMETNDSMATKRLPQIIEMSEISSHVGT